MIEELFGSMVFGDAVMKERLSPEVYEKFMHTVNEGEELDKTTATVYTTKSVQLKATVLPENAYGRWECGQEVRSYCQLPSCCLLLRLNSSFVPPILQWEYP